MKQRRRTDLDRWMRERMMPDHQFAALVTGAIKPPRVVSASAVAKWRLGVTMPRKAALVAIGNVTEGEVTSESFVHAEGP